MRFAPAAVLLAASVLSALPAVADVVLLKDGKRLEGEVADKGDAYEVKTPYGTLSVEKEKVKRIVKGPEAFTAKAETYRRIARGMYDDALRVKGDPKERNRKLTAGLELLERALTVYNEAREIFPGPEGEPLDKGASEVIMAMRMYRDKMASEEASSVPKPAPPVPQPEPRPGPSETSGDLPPVRPPTVDPRPIPPPPAPLPPSTKPKSARELIAGLDSPKASVRRAAAAGLAGIRAPEALDPLALAFEKEEASSVLDALVDALGSLDGARVARHAAIVNAGRKGTDPQKRALIALFRKAGTEAGMKFLVEHFVRTGDVANRNAVASALMKHKTLAVKPLVDCFNRAGGRASVRSDVVKYLGVIAESRKGALFLVNVLEMKPLRNTAIHALFKIDRPAVPALLAGLRGGNHTRLWSAWVLRGLTGQRYSSQKFNEWNRWWATHRSEIGMKEQRWEREEAARDWRVTDDDWAAYDHTISASDFSVRRHRGVRGGAVRFDGE